MAPLVFKLEERRGVVSSHKTRVKRKKNESAKNLVRRVIADMKKRNNRLFYIRVDIDSKLDRMLYMAQLHDELQRRGENYTTASFEDGRMFGVFVQRPLDVREDEASA